MNGDRFPGISPFFRDGGAVYVCEIIEVETKGRPLTIYLEGQTKMEGPATTVFSGTIMS